MTYRVRYDQCEDELTDATSVAEFFADRAEAWAPHGGRANAYWFAPVDTTADALRLDIDYDRGRAALRWLADGSHAVELDVTEPIVVLESSDRDVVTIPAELACVSIDTAQQAVIEYIETGRRPARIRWSV